MTMRSKSVLAVAVAGTVAAGSVGATTYNVTLKSVVSYSNSGSSAGNIASSTATWRYDDVTGLVTQTGGVYNVRFTINPATTLFRHSIEGLVIGNGLPATADTFTCTEGNFGTGVGASICGNYSFGANYVNESTASWGPGTDADRVLNSEPGGDDTASGPIQSIADYDNFTTVSFDAGPPGSLVLENGSCSGGGECDGPADYTSGYTFTFGDLKEVQLGAFDDEAEVESGVATEIDVLANDVGFGNDVEVTITQQPEHGTATAEGTVVTYTSDEGYNGPDSFTYEASDGSLTDTGVVTITVVDTVPDAFSFPSQADVDGGVVVVSDSATITGITSAPISVAGGEYSIGCTDTFTDVAGTIDNNEEVCVRHTSAGAPLTDTVTTLTIGGVEATFTSTTAAGVVDTEPDAFSFPAVTNADTSTQYVSDPITVSGIEAAAAISITGGEYSIAGGEYTSAAGTVNEGQEVTVRLTSSANASTATSAVLTIGGVSGTFTVTTAAPGELDLVPDAFSFAAKQRVAQNSVIESAPVTITGIDGPAPISVTGGEYSIGCDGDFTSAAGTITNGQTVCVRHTSAGSPGETTATVLSVGPEGEEVSATFTSQTRKVSSGSSSADGLLIGMLGLLGLARRRRR